MGQEDEQHPNGDSPLQTRNTPRLKEVDELFRQTNTSTKQAAPAFGSREGVWLKRVAWKMVVPPDRTNGEVHGPWPVSAL